MCKFPAVRHLFVDALGDPPPKGKRKAVADEVGTSIANVSRWYKGENRPESEFWAKLAKALGVPEDSVRRAAMAPSGESAPTKRAGTDHRPVADPAPSDSPGTEEVSRLSVTVALLTEEVKLNSHLLAQLRDHANLQDQDLAALRATVAADHKALLDFRSEYRRWKRSAG